MQWRDEFSLGNAQIDTQHKELFKRVGELCKLAESGNISKQGCADAIMFLKDYAVKHFADEEAFQEANGYAYLDYHKAIHTTFVSTVLSMEQRLLKSNFSAPAVKGLCGFLSMWLMHHVAGADQKIVTNEPVTVTEFALSMSASDHVLDSLNRILALLSDKTMGVEEAMQSTRINRPVKVSVEFDNTYNLCLTMSPSMALWLVSLVTSLKLTKVDEMAKSAIEQFARILKDELAGNRGVIEALSKGRSITFKTKMGLIAISFVAK